MTASQNELQKTMGNPLQANVDEMGKALTANKSHKKKKPNHINREEETRENRLIERKRKALDNEEAGPL